MFAALYNGNVAGGFGGSAVSAVDIALWDIAGKATGLPVSDLLGGRVRDRVAVYATGLYYTEGEFPRRLLDEAVGYVEAGFRGMKTKVGGLTMDEDVKRVMAIRHAIGPDIRLMVDANQAYDARSAIRLGQRLADCDILWFEEPVNAKDLNGYLQVNSALPMAIAGGENLRTRYEYKDFFAKGAYDIVQPDVTLVGGITEMRNVAMTANAFGVQVNPHVWGSPVMIAATLHVASTLSPCPTSGSPEPYVQEPVMEFDRTPNAIREELCANPFDQVDGFIDVPTGPGLGIEVDEKALTRLSVG
jgi:D-galactarolactone cycloisomerase